MNVNTKALRIATALNLEYIIGTNWVEWYKVDGSEVRKAFKSTFELSCYLEGVLLVIDL